MVAILLLSVLVLPYVVEMVISLTVRRWKRRDYFRRAREKARLTGKPLMVIGDPDTGCVNHYFGRDYDCGDVCLDLTGCPRCPDGTRKIRGSLEEALPGMPTGGYVVFVSCTLEYVEGIRSVVDELQRVSGGDLYVVNVEPYSPLHFLLKTRQILTSAPPDSQAIAWKPVPPVYRWLHGIYDPISRPFMKGTYD